MLLIIIMLMISVVSCACPIELQVCKILHTSYYLFAHSFQAEFGGLIQWAVEPISRQAHAIRASTAMVAAFGEVRVGDPFLAGPSLEPCGIRMECGRRASARLHVIFSTHRLASAPDDVLGCQAAGSVARIHYQLRFRHYGGIVILRMICRDDDAIELWDMVQRGTGHIKRIPAAAPC